MRDVRAGVCTDSVFATTNALINFRAAVDIVIGLLLNDTHREQEMARMSLEDVG